MATINGVEFDHSSHVFRVNARQFVGLKEANYGHGMEGGQKIHGTSTVPIGRTNGIYVPDSPSITLYYSDYVELQQMLEPGYMNKKVFSLSFEMNELGNFVRDSIKSCKIIKEESGTSEGGEAKTMKLTLDCMGVKFNDTDPVDQTFNAAL